VWSDLLRERWQDRRADNWVAQARDALWKRLGSRFYFRPEADFRRSPARRRSRFDEKPAQGGRRADSGKKSNVARAAGGAEP
jgi:hypothetical protein